jgi:hypothetical protein
MDRGNTVVLEDIGGTWVRGSEHTIHMTDAVAQGDTKKNKMKYIGGTINSTCVLIYH